jgi:hypothetical protein
MGGSSPVSKIIQAVSPKSMQQPKVQSQIAAPQPITAPAGPTTVEAYSKGKRSGRKYALLTSSAGATDVADIQLKTLLGG